MSDIELDVHSLVNRRRTLGQLPLLVLDLRVSMVARQHSLAMSSGDVPIGHARFQERVSRLVGCFPVLSADENVTVLRFSRSVLALMAVQEWLDSPAHRENIYREHDTTGVGIILGEDGYYYITQVYIRTR